MKWSEEGQNQNAIASCVLTHFGGACGGPNCHQMVRRIQRQLIANATIVNQNADGQVIFPSHLLDYASIDTSAVVIVFDQKLEIWNRGILESHFKVPPRIKRSKMAKLCKQGEKNTTGLFSQYLCPDVQSALNR